jgi:hypothetical protein
MHTYTCTRIYLTHASAAAAAPSLGTISSLKGPEPAKSAVIRDRHGRLLTTMGMAACNSDTVVDGVGDPKFYCAPECHGFEVAKIVAPKLCLVLHEFSTGCGGHGEHWHRWGLSHALWLLRQDWLACRVWFFFYKEILRLNLFKEASVQHYYIIYNI